MHILQAALVYVNTLMIQDLLADPEWATTLTDEDRRGLTPLFWLHLLPYGEIKLNMSRRLQLSAPPAENGNRPDERPCRGTQADAGPAKAQQLAKYLRSERPDYAYLKDVFRHLRSELGVEVPRAPKTLPYVPTEAEIRASTTPSGKPAADHDVVLIKTLLYTGVASPSSSGSASPTSTSTRAASA